MEHLTDVDVVLGGLIFSLFLYEVVVHWMHEDRVRARFSLSNKKLHNEIETRRVRQDATDQEIQDLKDRLFKLESKDG